MLHISLAAERLWTLWGLPISNAFITTWVVMAFLIVLCFLATRKLTLIPGNAQLMAEMVVGGLHNLFGAIAGRHINQFFPLVASLFIFILASNWVGLLPGVGTIGFFRTEEVTVQEQAGEAPAVSEHEATGVAPQAEEVPKEHSKSEFVPLLRAATADLNMTLALAIVSVMAMQYFGFRNLGTHYISRFISFKNPINFSVGLLELISDISKVISFAFRLFGNIFAGEVLLAVIAFLMPFIVPLPFLMLELFVGFIQALVFSMLSTAFFSVAVSHGEDEHAPSHASK